MPLTLYLTGASRGLGRALLDTFRAQGHAVVACSLRGSPDGVDAVDVADDAAVGRWAAAALARQGPPDLLINNAAVMNRPAPLWQVPAAEFDRLMAVNVNGIANVVRHLVPAMVARRRGIVVNLSSGWGRSTSPDVAPYCASKFAVEGLSAALAQELPSGMACVALNPGIIRTDMLRQCWADEADAYPDAQDWVRRAAPFLLGLTARDNGRALTVPGESD